MLTTCGLRNVVVVPLACTGSLAFVFGPVLLSSFPSAEPSSLLSWALSAAPGVVTAAAGASLPYSPYLDDSCYSPCRSGGSLCTHSDSLAAVRLSLVRRPSHIPADPRFRLEACQVSAIAPA